jgi:hypothetical protein
MPTIRDSSSGSLSPYKIDFTPNRALWNQVLVIRLLSPLNNEIVVISIFNRRRSKNDKEPTISLCFESSSVLKSSLLQVGGVMTQSSSKRRH